VKISVNPDIGLIKDQLYIVHNMPARSVFMQINLSLNISIIHKFHQFHDSVTNINEYAYIRDISILCPCEKLG